MDDEGTVSRRSLRRKGTDLLRLRAARAFDAAPAFLRWVNGFPGSLAREGADTTFHRLQQDVGAFFERDEALSVLLSLWQAIVEVLRDPDMRDWVAKEFLAGQRDQTNTTDPRLQKLRDRVLQLGARHPRWMLFQISFAAERQPDGQHPVLVEAMRTARGFAAVLKARRRKPGEHRAQEAVAALLRVAEGPYKDALQILWRLHMLDTGKLLGEPNEIGRLSANLAESDGDMLIELIHPLRNAVAHDRWSYDVGADAIIWHNVNHAGRVSKQGVVRVDDLLDLLEECLVYSSAIPDLIRKVVFLQAFEETDVLRLGLEALATEAPDAREAARTAFASEVRRAFGLEAASAADGTTLPASRAVGRLGARPPSAPPSGGAASRDID